MNEEARKTSVELAFARADLLDVMRLDPIVQGAAPLSVLHQMEQAALALRMFPGSGVSETMVANAIARLEEFLVFK